MKEEKVKILYTIAGIVYVFASMFFLGWWAYNNALVTSQPIDDCRNSERHKTYK